MTFIKRILMVCLAISCVMSVSFPGSCFAEEITGEGGGEGAEGDAGEMLAVTDLGAASSDGLTPGTIETNIEGKYLALTFPDSVVPAGFTTTTVPYEGEVVELAQMTAKPQSIGAEGMVITLAYLTDADGSNGDFYLCDTTENAMMSDMIMIQGKGDHYIIVLDPGDNVSGPDGFKKKELQFYGKNAVAWALPSASTSSDEESDGAGEEGEESSSALPFTQKVYAAGLNAGVGNLRGSGSGSGSGGGEDDGILSEEEYAEAVKQEEMIALEAVAHTNASGLVAAQTKDFCLFYAVSDTGDLGFYLYDIANDVYMRYVDIPHGETDTTRKYRSLSQTRLIIIIVLAVLLLIAIIVIFNLMLSRRNRDYDYEDEEYDDDGDDDVEAMRRRVAEKERSRIQKGRKSLNFFPDNEEEYDDDYEDEDDEDEDEDEDDEEYYRPSPRAERDIPSRGTQSSGGAQTIIREEAERVSRRTRMDEEVSPVRRDRSDPVRTGGAVQGREVVRTRTAVDQAERSQMRAGHSQGGDEYIKTRPRNTQRPQVRTHQTPLEDEIPVRESSRRRAQEKQKVRDEYGMNDDKDFDFGFDFNFLNVNNKDE